jgi:allantoin racemase
VHILLINPNSTASMTEQALASALRVKQPGTRVTATNPTDTPASIEGGADEAVAVPGMLSQIRKGEAEGIDAYVIACFDDPGLHAAREVARGPVIGICQAAVQVAMTISRRFSVITTLPRSIPIIEDLVVSYGANHHCRNVRAIDLPVLALEEDPLQAERLLAKEIERAKKEDRAEAIVLGMRRHVGAWRAAECCDRCAGHRRRYRCGEVCRSAGRCGVCDLEGKCL